MKRFKDQFMTLRRQLHTKPLFSEDGKSATETLPTISPGVFVPAHEGYAPFRVAYSLEKSASTAPPRDPARIAFKVMKTSG